MIKRRYSAYVKFRLKGRYWKLKIFSVSMTKNFEFVLLGSTKYSGKSLLANSMLLRFLIAHTRTVSTHPISKVLRSAHLKLHLNFSIDNLKVNHRFLLLVP